MKMLRKQRALLLLFIYLIFGIYLTGRLAIIQLAGHGEWSAAAVEQRSRSVLLDYNRGDILDRHGTSLLGKTEEKVLVVFPSLLQKEKSKEVRQAAEALTGGPAGTDRPYIALRNLSAKEAERFRELSAEGLVVAAARSRYGPDGLASHLLGHTGPEGRGRVGLELVFDQELQGGEPLMLAALVDGKDRLIEGLGHRLLGGQGPGSPRNLVLTMDAGTQKKVEEIMDRKVQKGAVVVMDAGSGDLLAAASRPNYTQELLPFYLDGSEKNDPFLDGQPFINRSILSYPPASIFKIVVAAAALDSGMAEISSSFYCPGHVEVGEDTFRCHNGRAHGRVNLAEAFAHSCNAVFIELAMELGREKLYSYAVDLGVGRLTGVPLGSAAQGGERAGYYPLPWEMPYLGELALAAIGQGKVEMTPLQVARLTSFAANGGYLVEPRLVKALQLPGGRTIKEFPPEDKKMVLDPLATGYLQYMMRAVVEFGTGRAADAEGLKAAGKTGTAQTGREGGSERYYWFSGYFKLKDQTVVVTVFVEEPQKNNTRPADIFREIALALYPQQL